MLNFKIEILVKKLESFKKLERQCNETISYIQVNICRNYYPLYFYTIQFMVYRETFENLKTCLFIDPVRGSGEANQTGVWEVASNSKRRRSVQDCSSKERGGTEKTDDEAEDWQHKLWYHMSHWADSVSEEGDECRWFSCPTSMKFVSLNQNLC